MMLNIYPFTPDEFCFALTKPSPSILLTELHVRLLRHVLGDTRMLREKRQVKSPLGTPLLQQLPPPVAVTPTSWPEVLRCSCWLLPAAHEDVDSRAALDALASCEYSALSLAHKLALLRGLCNLFLDLGVAGPASARRPVHEVVHSHLETQKAYLRERREAEAKCKRDTEEEHAKIDGAMREALAEATTTLSSEAFAAKLAADAAAEEARFAGPRDHQARAFAKQTAEAAAAAMQEHGMVPFASPPAQSDAEESAAAAEAASKQKAREERREQARKRARATQVMLSAIECRDVEPLRESIRLGERSQHEGEHTDGRPWRSDELKAAKRVLAEAVAHRAKAKIGAKVAEKETEAFARYLELVGLAPTREEPLGVDASGRRYWVFVNDVISNPARLYVQQSPSAAAGGAAGWRWAFFDTVSHVKALARSLDAGEEGHADEARLKAALRERMVLLERTMPDEGWHYEGHEYIGQRLTSVHEPTSEELEKTKGRATAWESNGRVFKWLPPKPGKPAVPAAPAPDGEAEPGAAQQEAEPAVEAEIELFHVVHDDGDVEDLEEHQARAAIALYKEREAAGTLSLDSTDGYSNKSERRVVARIASQHLGAVGLRDEILEIEELLAAGLQRAGSSWGNNGSESARSIWLMSCRASENVPELAQLLQTLEATVRQLQTLPDIAERKPWVKTHPWVNKPARRFFPGLGASDGKITGYLPAEGTDVALWHMVHGDDADEEDLDEAEAQFALANFAENRAELTAEETEYASQFATAQKEEEDDDDEEEEDDDDDGAAADDDEWGGASLGGDGLKRRATRGDAAAAAAAAAGGTRSGAARGSSAGVFYGDFSKKRLWVTADARERWLACLGASSPSVASVSLAATAFRQHARAFGVLASDKDKVRRDDSELQLQSWCHANALPAAATHGKKSHKKKKAKW